VLPETGQYTLLVDPAQRHTGIAQLRLIGDTDQIGQITVNGPSVAAKIAKPGAIVKLSFTATAGQKLLAQIGSATLPDDCFPLEIRDANAEGSFAFGCVRGGKGQTAPWTVPKTGTYTVVLDPRAAATGSGDLELITS
jgi:hypothetical protein